MGETAPADGLEGWELRGRGAYCEAAGALVVADVHVGRDESSNVAFPLGERADLAERLGELCSYFEPGEVVLAGDVLHSFGSASSRVRAALDELVEVCRGVGARPVAVAGNHDALLEEVWEGSVRRTYRVGDALVCHGHERPDEATDRFVLGHDHPTIRIEGERRPCFLAGPGAPGGTQLLMLPAFNRLAPGVEVNGMDADAFASPLVVDADALRPAVYDRASRETLWFPQLGAFRGML